MSEGVAMGFGEFLIDEIDWDQYDVCGGGSARRLVPTLRSFINSASSEESMKLWFEIENVAFAQSTLYGAAEPVCDVAVAALADERTPNARLAIVELLRFVLSGDSLEDRGLAERCRMRVQPGVWLLALEARTASGEDRSNALEVIRLVDPARADLVSAALESHE